VKRRRALCLGLGLATLVAGCGFQPVYDTQGSGVGPVSVSEIPGRTGFLVRQELLRRAALERGEGQPRQLDVRLVTQFAGTSNQITGYATRTQMTVSANYRLVGSTNVEGYVQSNVAYDGLNEAFGDVALQADAEERVAVLLADRIWMDLVRKVKAAR
jgi:LPS-assembly lipoprotein